MPCGCESPYVLNPATGLCEWLVYGGFEVGNNPKTIPNICVSGENMVNGTLVFPTINPAQFPLTGQNNPYPTYVDSSAASITAAVGILSGNLWISGGNVANGLLNQRGVGLPAPVNTWYGLSRCFTVAPNSITSVAISSKTAFRFYLDGVLAVIYQPAYPVQGNTYLQVFPLNLSAGSHTIRAEGFCREEYVCREGTHYGNLLVEVYTNLDAVTLAGITSQGVLNNYYTPVNSNIPLLTPGLQFDVSSVDDFSNYYCPVGSYLVSCDVPGSGGSFTCPVTYTLPYTPCCYGLVECTTGVVIKSTTQALAGYLGHVIRIEEASGCYMITNLEGDCEGAITTTTTEIFNNCITCTQVYYKLVDCNGVAADVYTTSDLSTYIGSSVKISGYNDTCWIPVVFTPLVGTIYNYVPVTVGLEFDSCEDCLYVPPTPLPDPPFYQLSPVDLKTRSVQPGYDTGECSSDFVEKVNCNFAQQVYSKMTERKYGVETCIEDEFDKYLIKKELLDLNLIDDPNYCKTITCCAPSCVTVELQEFLTVTTAPTNISVELEPIIEPCLPPENVEARIEY